MRVFHISVSRWSFTDVWVTASLLKSLGLFSVFWPISMMQLFGWSPLVLLMPSPPVPLLILWWLDPEHHLQLVWMSLECSTVFSLSSPDRGNSFHFLSILHCGPQFANSLFLLIIIRSGRLTEIRWSVWISKSYRSLCVSFSRTDAGVVHISFVRMVKLKFLVRFPVDYLAHPIVSCLIFLLY